MVFNRNYDRLLIFARCGCKFFQRIFDSEDNLIIDLKVISKNNSNNKFKTRK